MEPPLKRPRLSIVPEDTKPDSTLTRARYRNDLGLKSRLEAIFEKYSHDFTGIGDEIDMATGKVVVNRGHLESMENERDTGTPAFSEHAGISRHGQCSGGSLLRAMTVAPDEHSSTFDRIQDYDVIESIETMAEHAADYGFDEFTDENDQSGDTTDSSSREHTIQYLRATGEKDSEIGEEDTDNELFPEIKERRENDSESTYVSWPKTSIAENGQGLPSTLNSISTVSQQDVAIKEEDFDGQALFLRGPSVRPPSSESLFDQEESPGSQRLHQSNHARFPILSTRDTVDSQEVSDDAVLAKFGERGPEVLDVLAKRQALMNSHIEPAWRLPDLGIAFPTRISQESDVPELPLNKLDRRGESIWAGSRHQGSNLPLQMLLPAKSAAKQDARAKSIASVESGDPLQEDFYNQSRHKADEHSIIDEESDFKPDPEEDINLDDLLDATCPFCRRQFSVRSSVFVHWDDLIKRDVDDGIHDLYFIKEQRKRKRRRTEFPKLRVEDFQKVIKLHEVDGLDWREMHEQGYFGKRPLNSIQSIYYHYRRIAKTDEELAADGRSWTVEENERLLRFCQDPRITFQTLKKKMKGRTQAEIGNRLASHWMQQYADQGIDLPCPRFPEDGALEAVEAVQSGRVESFGFIGPRFSSTTPHSFRRSGSHNSTSSLFDGWDSEEDLFG